MVNNKSMLPGLPLHTYLTRIDVLLSSGSLVPETICDFRMHGINDGISSIINKYIKY